MLKIPKSECPDILIRLPRHKWPKYCQTLKTQLFFSNETFADIHSLASGGKDSLKKFYLDLDGKKYRIENACSFIENKD